MDAFDIDTKALLAELDAQKIDHTLIDSESRVIEVRFAGLEPLLIQRAQSRYHSKVGHFIAKKKDLSGRLVAAQGVPLPRTIDATESDDEALDLLREAGTVVVKPNNGAHGNDVVTDVTSKELLTHLLSSLRSNGLKPLVQQQVTGEDMRILVIGGKLAGALARYPASILGDGVHTVRELIQLENQKDTRGKNYKTELNEINIAAAEIYMGESIESIPADGDTVRVIGPANVGQGGHLRRHYRHY